MIVSLTFKSLKPAIIAYVSKDTKMLGELNMGLDIYEKIANADLINWVNPKMVARQMVDDVFYGRLVKEEILEPMRKFSIRYSELTNFIKSSKEELSTRGWVLNCFGSFKRQNGSLLRLASFRFYGLREDILKGSVFDCRSFLIESTAEFVMHENDTLVFELTHIMSGQRNEIIECLKKIMQGYLDYAGVKCKIVKKEYESKEEYLKGEPKSL